MEKIIESVASEQFKEDYVRYAVYTLYSRVMPDYRDGLKPIHRRILWAMYHNSGAITHTVKSATVVGDVIGKWHPHGDASAYGAIKPLANWFECKIPLVDKQGNFGTIQGEGASASRYTECKLSKFAVDYVIGDLRESKECINWEPNFDNTDYEPESLPCAVPLLLINGTFAIGVGKKPQIPSHNLAEVIDATLTLIQNPNTEITLVPDHCMPCEIVDTDWAAISRTGYGYYTVRGVIDIENYNGAHYKNRTALVIKSMPNLVFLNRSIDKIDSMIANKKIIQIEEMFDESSEFEMRYVIILKPGADPEYVRDTIYKNTDIEVRDRINFEALNGLNPVRLSYKSYLLSFIDHRKLTKYRMYSNKLQMTQTRIYEREAYVKALESGSIDEIITMIRKRKGSDDAELTEYLVKKLNITTLQAQYIINVPLKKLAIGNLPKYKADLKELNSKKKEYMDIILSDEKLTQTIVNELLEIREKYGVPRTCRVVSDNGLSEVPKGAMTVVFTEKNFVKKVPLGTAIGNFRGDSVKLIINADNSDSILIFDNIGKVFKLPINRIPFADRNSGGVDIRFLIKGLTANIASIIPENAFMGKNTKMYLITLTKAGLIKKMEVEDFVSIPSSGLIYVKLDQGDFVQTVKFGNDMMNALIFSERKAMNFPVSMIPLMKRNAKGNKTFRADLVDGMTLIPTREAAPQLGSVSLLVITENGRFNKLPILSVPNLDSVKKPFSAIKLYRDRIIDIHLVDESSVVMVKTLENLHQIPVSAIPASSTISAGDKILNTVKDKIIRTYIQQMQ